MIERFKGDPNVDLLPEIFLDDDTEDYAISYSGLAEAASAELFDDPDLIQADIDGLTELELKEKAAQEQSKIEIERICALNAEERTLQGLKDSHRGFSPRVLRPQLKLLPPPARKAGGLDPAAQRNVTVEQNLRLAGRQVKRLGHKKQTDLFLAEVIELIRTGEKADQQGDITPEQVEEYLELPLANIGLDEIDEPEFYEAGYDEAESRVFAEQVAPLVTPALHIPVTDERTWEIFLLYATRDDTGDLPAITFEEIGKRFDLSGAGAYRRYIVHKLTLARLLTKLAFGGDSSGLSF